MVFAADDKQLIKSLRQLKGYSSRLKKLVEMLDLSRGLDYLMSNVDKYGTVESSRQWQYEFITVNSQTTTSAFHKIVYQQY